MAGGEAQVLQGLSKGRTSRESVSPFVASDQMFPWEDQCEWHRMTRMTGLGCAVMCNLINAHTHTHI